MPLYEYQCPTCGRFELVQKFSDAPLTVCPTCQAPVEKLLSAPAFHLKGTGWYVTDYAKKSGGESKKSDESGKKADDSKKSGDEGKSADSGKKSESSDSAKSSSASDSSSTSSKDSAATGSGSSK